MGRAIGRAALAATAVAALATAVAAQPAYRVKDIGTAGYAGSAPGRFTALNGIVYFSAADAANGFELWRTDGTAAGSRLVRDIEPGPDSSSPTSLTVAGGALFFSAAGGLWRSDGTAAGTVRIRPDLRDPLDLVELGGTLYITAEHVGYGRELWRTIGTDAGTALVRDILPGPVGSYPLWTIAVGQALYFAAIGPEGDELWKSDGTEAGTVLVRDIVPGGLSSAPEYLTPSGGSFFFRAGTVAEGRELWKSDGTEAGTVLVKDVQPGPPGSFPTTLTMQGGVLYFAADDGATGVEPWKSDGTTAGTVRIRDVRPGPDPSYPQDMTRSGGRVYFTADDGVNGREVWQTDGSAVGTALIGPIQVPEDGGPFELADRGGVLYFRADDGVHGAELWRTDGTAAGTSLLDLHPGPAPSNPGSLAVVNGALYFGGVPAGLAASPHFGEPWTSDGTLAGSRVIAFLNSEPSLGFGESVAYAGALFFGGSDGIHGFELWRSDGTEAGTYLVKDLVPGPDGGAPNFFAIMGGALYFIGRHPGGFALWRTDGTAAGTTPVHALPGLGLSLVATPDQLFFVATDPATGYELWRSDGTDAGTRLVKDITPGPNQSFIFEITPFGSEVLFGASDPVEGGELWRSDGTEAGTVRVTVIEPGPGGSNPGLLHVTGGLVYFNAETSAHGREPWVTDGTAAGTREVADVWPGPEASSPQSLVSMGSTLFFLANDGAHGYELWRSDGTAAGTSLVKDVFPGSNLAGASRLTRVAGGVVFVGNDGATGREPWRSDGTAAGTFPLADIQPGPEDSMATIPVLREWGGHVFFGATAAATGHELYRTDGTTAGTRLLQDIGPGIASAGLGQDLNPAAGRLFFTAADAAGVELWALLPELTVADAVADEGTQATVGVTLVPALDVPLAVPFTTADGTAQATLDYVPRAGTLTFAPGTTTQAVDVTVLDDALDEPDEDFFLDLSGPVPAYLADARGRVVVRDDDPTLVFSVDDVAVTEGDVGDVTAAFTVRLSPPPPVTASVDYATVPGTAIHGVPGEIDDFSPRAGTLTFAAGVATQVVNVPVHGDPLDEPDEFFLLRLRQPTAAVLGDDEGLARIRDDDGGTIRLLALERDTDHVDDVVPQPAPDGDLDVYLLRSEPWSSYEITIDAVSGDMSVPGPFGMGPYMVAVTPSSGLTLNSTPIGTRFARSVRIDQAADDPLHHYIKVGSNGCSTDCGPDDTYRIRVRETTGHIARFNNVGNQRTVLVLQNRIDQTIDARVSFWGSDGTRLLGQSRMLAPHASSVIDTTSLVGSASGSITVSHDGPYGALAGKAVALDPTTGFAFDTPLTTRPR